MSIQKPVLARLRALLKALASERLASPSSKKRRPASVMPHESGPPLFESQ
ncbi:hypothetical protein [uncultured Ottowia sp.]|nr:hypothetical protein [uncultured Ottowia sp.]